MLTKCVDGKIVEMSAEEEAAIRAEWESNSSGTKGEKKRVTVEALVDLLKAKGLIAQSEL
jgi:hypothetical protein